MTDPLAGHSLAAWPWALATLVALATAAPPLAQALAREVLPVGGTVPAEPWSAASQRLAPLGAAPGPQSAATSASGQLSCM